MPSTSGVKMARKMLSAGGSCFTPGSSIGRNVSVGTSDADTLATLKGGGAVTTRIPVPVSTAVIAVVELAESGLGNLVGKRYGTVPEAGIAQEEVRESLVVDYDDHYDDLKPRRIPTTWGFAENCAQLVKFLMESGRCIVTWLRCVGRICVHTARGRSFNVHYHRHPHFFSLSFLPLLSCSYTQ